MMKMSMNLSHEYKTETTTHNEGKLNRKVLHNVSPFEQHCNQIV